MGSSGRKKKMVSYISGGKLASPLSNAVLWKGDTVDFIQQLRGDETYDLVVSSPPYNIGKEYESSQTLEEYLKWHDSVVGHVASKLSKNGSICWQVGNYVENGYIEPLDIHIHSMFRKRGFKLLNRIVWRYGHGLHCKKRFSGRYEVVMWYTRSDKYVFNLDKVRIPSKYPSKRSYRGPNAGQYSSNPKGKNPEDVWDFAEDVWSIPNVKGNHQEKTAHPCQFPVGLVQRLVLALTNEKQVVFDPFTGAGSAGVAALSLNRKFWGAEIDSSYTKIARDRLTKALNGTEKYRPHDKPIYDHRKSRLSQFPAE